MPRYVQKIKLHIETGRLVSLEDTYVVDMYDTLDPIGCVVLISLGWLLAQCSIAVSVSFGSGLPIYVFIYYASTTAYSLR